MPELIPLFLCSSIRASFHAWRKLVPIILPLWQSYFLFPCEVALDLYDVLHRASDSFWWILFIFSQEEPCFGFHPETQSIRWASVDTSPLSRKPYCYLVHVYICYVFCLSKILLVCVLESCLSFGSKNVSAVTLPLSSWVPQVVPSATACSYSEEYLTRV